MITGKLSAVMRQYLQRDLQMLDLNGMFMRILNRITTIIRSSARQNVCWKRNVVLSLRDVLLCRTMTIFWQIRSEKMRLKPINLSRITPIMMWTWSGRIFYDWKTRRISRKTCSLTLSFRKTFPNRWTRSWKRERSLWCCISILKIWQTIACIMRSPCRRKQTFMLRQALRKRKNWSRRHFRYCRIR